MRTLWLFLVCGALLMPVPAIAQDGGCGCGCFEDECGCMEDECGGGEHGMEMQMPAWMAPAKEHDALKRFVGSWDTTFSFMGQTEKGAMVWKLVMDGRYVEGHVTGTMAGQSWEGKWMLGFDTVEKKYVSIWFDSMSPIPIIAHGTEKDGLWAFTFEEPDIMDPAGKKKKGRMTLRWEGDDKYVLSAFTLMPDGSEQPMWQIHHARKK